MHIPPPGYHPNAPYAAGNEASTSTRSANQQPEPPPPYAAQSTRNWPWSGLTAKIKNPLTPEAKIDNEIKKYKKRISHRPRHDEMGKTIDSLRGFSGIQNKMEKVYGQGKLSKKFVNSRSAKMSEIAIKTKTL
jgi:hypothetical protein